MSSVVPEGWNIRLAENLFVREKVKVTHDRNSVSKRGSYPVIDQSEDGEIGFVDVLPEFDCSPQNPIVTFANHTCAVRKMTTPFGVIQNVFPLSSQVDSDVNFVYQALLSAIEPEGYKGHYPKLRETEFLTPPLPEQKKIASILTSVDEVIENTQKQIDKLQDLKKATMNELLTKGIGHTEFKDSELGRIPKSWEVVNFSDITTLITKGTTPSSIGCAFTESGINFIKVESIVSDGNIDPTKFSYVEESVHHRLKRSQIRNEDILITIAGATVGKLAIVESKLLPANTNQALAIVRFKRGIVRPLFAFYFLQGWYIKNLIGRSQTVGAQPNISLAQIANFPIPLIELSEQDLIVESLCSFDKSIADMKGKLSQTQSLKKSLMQDLLTGKVRVKVD